jgi:branched-chain amino acid transport system ATP-binding protein
VNAALEVVGVRVDRDTAVLLDVAELIVEGGTVAVVTGATDSGKTLLAAVLSGRTDATVGLARVNGRPLAGGPAARRRSGLAATVADGARISGCTVSEALRLAGARRATAALDRFALLARRSDVRADLLSGGEQQLLQVACAWCAAPRVLVLDAPTTGLAEDIAESVRDVARDAAADGAAVLWLDQSDRNTPQRAGWRLVSGVLSAEPATASTSDPA